MFERRSTAMPLSPAGSTVTGYAATFNSPTQIQTRSGDTFTEVIEPGAFMGNEAADVVCLLNHDENLILGRSPNTLRFNEDAKGLAFSADLDTDPANHIAAYARRLLERGEIRGCSFAFEVLADEWRSENNKPVRSLKSLKLRDISIVVNPAYPSTSVDLRSVQIVEAPKPRLSVCKMKLKMIGLS